MIFMATLTIHPAPKHHISPYLYMQFMEPLGVCDSSVDAAWDFVGRKWYDNVIRRVRDLAPTMVRFGGCFASYYRWREAVGPARIPMINHCWGGCYANQVGTHEIIDFCRQVNAEPLLVVNMESDGRMHWAYPPDGTDRFGTAQEAADWVRYCNDPDDRLRKAHGVDAPYSVKWWQIGNETSYDTRGYGSAKTAEVTRRFAREMLRADGDLKLIGWGDNWHDDDTWCRTMRDVEEIGWIAFHHHYGSGLPDSPLTGTEYRLDPEKTWMHLQNAHLSMENHIAQMRAECGDKRLAMTEGHFALPGRNRNEVLSTWAAGAAYARIHNVIMRNSDILDIATMADFFGNVWQVNAVMIPTPAETNEPYLQPVGAVMRLFKRHQGEQAVDVRCDGAVDVTASRTGNTIYIHAANTSMTSAQELTLDLGGAEVERAEMEWIAADPMAEITPVNADVFQSRTAVLEGTAVTLPAAAVAAIEVVLKG